MQEGSLLVCIEDALPPVVRASGELDYTTCGEFESILTQALHANHGTVVLELGELSFIDSCGIRALVKAAVNADKAGRRLVISSMTPHLDHVLSVSGFRDMFAVTPTAESSSQIVRPSAAEDYCFQVPGRPDTCRRVRNNVAAFARDMGFSALAVDDIKLAVGEAVSNAVRHGSVQDDSIDVRCRNEAGTMSVTLRYPSRSFDPDSVPPPTYASAPEGGMGIHFMKLVMDRVGYNFKDGYTELTIQKKLQ